jgi:hypothetical protein
MGGGASKPSKINDISTENPFTKGALLMFMAVT